MPKNDEIQYRDFVCESLVMQRQEGSDSPGIVDGYAAVYEQLSQPMWGFREKIAPGAFERAIKEKQDVRALVDHESSMLLGRTKSGTLKLSSDERGLRSVIDLPNTTVGRDTSESLRRRDLDQMSFAFTIKDEIVERGAGSNGEDIRTLVDVDLFDVSVVTYPAYLGTSAVARQFRQWVIGKKTRRAESRVRAALLRQRIGYK